MMWLVCGALAGLKSGLFFCDHTVTPAWYKRSQSHIKQFYALCTECCGLLVRQIWTGAIFIGGTCYRTNSTGTILALTIQDLGFRIECFQFNQQNFDVQKTTRLLNLSSACTAIQGTFPKNLNSTAIHWNKKRPRSDGILERTTILVR
jgi:hypothetical protein